MASNHFTIFISSVLPIYLPYIANVIDASISVITLCIIQIVIRDTDIIHI